VKTIDKSPPSEAHPGWQLLGEFKQPVDLNTANIVYTWLTEILGPLNLHTDFLNKILKSAQDALQHVLTSAQVTLESEQIHLLVFAQNKPVSGPHSWGFFRIEKAENAVENERQLVHRIEIYLYLEG